MQLPVCGDSEVKAVRHRTSVSDLQIAADDDTARNRLSANHDLHRKWTTCYIRERAEIKGFNRLTCGIWKRQTGWA